MPLKFNSEKLQSILKRLEVEFFLTTWKEIPPGFYHEGTILLFMQKKFSGSYCVFIFLKRR